VVEAVTAPVPTAAPAAPARGSSKPEITCFRCRAKGHKAPDCPLKPKGNRRVQTKDREPLRLESEEVFGYIGKWGMCMTVDTGAQVSVVPVECLEPGQMLGSKLKVRSFQGELVEGECCNVKFVVNGKEFHREAVGVKGELINWTPCLRVPLSPREDMEFFMAMAEERRGKNQQLYQPLRIQDGRLKTGYLVSKGVGETQTLDENMPKVPVIEKEEETGEDSIRGMMSIGIEEGERSSVECAEESGDHGTMEEAERDEKASELVEVSGEPSEGSAVTEPEISVDGIKGDRSMLVEDTKNDPSLRIARGLAEREQEGYKYKDGVVMRSRMDKMGDVKTQISSAIWAEIRCANSSPLTFTGRGCPRTARAL